MTKISSQKKVVNLCGLKLGSGFFEMIPKPQATKEKNKMTSSKLKRKNMIKRIYKKSIANTTLSACLGGQERDGTLSAPHIHSTLDGRC